jgi:hypothetical protein
MKPQISQMNPDIPKIDQSLSVPIGGSISYNVFCSISY